MLRASPCGAAHLAQSKLVRLLLGEAKASPLITVSFGTTVEAIAEVAATNSAMRSSGGVPDGSRAQVTTRARGNTGRLISYGSNFVIGADGAGSTVRQLAGIGLHSGRVLQNLMNVHFSVPPETLRGRLNERGMLYFVFNPDVVCVVVRIHGIRVSPAHHSPPRESHPIRRLW